MRIRALVFSGLGFALVVSGGLFWFSSPESSPSYGGNPEVAKSEQSGRPPQPTRIALDKPQEDFQVETTASEDTAQDKAPVLALK